MGGERIEREAAVLDKYVVAGFSRLRHTSTVGGVSDTEQAAITVVPRLPATPSVVTIWT